MERDLHAGFIQKMGWMSLLGGESLHEVGELKYFGSMFIANGWGTDEIRNRVYLASSAILSLVAVQFCPAAEGRGQHISLMKGCLRSLIVTSSVVSNT